MVEAFQRLEVVGDIIPSKLGTQEMETHPGLHNHLRARFVRLAQNQRTCTSDEILVHELDDNLGKTEEPFDEPLDEHVGPENISTANVYGPETAHSAAHRRGGV